jgi:glucose/arabinose dehydrogenase
VAQPPRAGRNYCIPADNPFVGDTSYLPEIWALGLRNPWRFSFDRLTGDLYTADVGQNRQEEVNFQPAGSDGGENYGWRIREGNLCYDPMSGCVSPPGYSAPVAVYDHGPNDSNGCSITGGYVYRGPLFYKLRGVYVNGDLCTGKIYGLKNEGGWQNTLLTDAPFSITTFGEDEAGLLFVADYGGGAIYRVNAEIDYSQLTERMYFPVISR